MRWSGSSSVEASPAAAVALIADGIDAYHVRDRGILGATDHELLERAFDEDRILITSNVDDFAKLASAREIHAGIVLIERAGLLRDEQMSKQALSARGGMFGAFEDRTS